MGRSRDKRRVGEADYRALVAAKLEAARRDRGVSQAEIARQLASQPTTVGRWFAGSSTPSLYDLVGIAEVLDLPFAPLVDPAATVADVKRAIIDRDEERGREELDVAQRAASTSGPVPPE